MEKLKEKLNIPNIIILYIILQPIIDIVTALSIEYGKITITLGIIIRTIFMAFCVILGVLKANKKYKIGMLIYYGLLLFYMIGFLINSYINNGMNLIFIQIRGLIKNFYLPVIIVGLIPIFKECKVDISKKVLSTTLIIYLITIFICSILGIGFSTYKAGDKSGTVGLFYSANEIGAILCLLAPFLVVDMYNRKLKVFDYVCLALLIYGVLQVGTKVPYFGLMLLVITVVFSCIINGKVQKNKYLYKKAGIFFALFIAIYMITGLTPVGENLTKIYGDIFPVTLDDFRSETTQEPPKLNEFKDFEELKTTTISGRDDFLKVNKEKFINGSICEKIFGIGFIKNENGQIEELKLTEMDYYDIIFCNGILGTILFAVPILAFVIVLIRYTNLDKTKIGVEQIYSIIMAIVVSLLAGHVLTSPAVSIYIAIILLKYYYDVQPKNRLNGYVENKDVM